MSNPHTRFDVKLIQVDKDFSETREFKNITVNSYT